MPGPTSTEGYAIVSEDGMMADAENRIPPGLVVPADQAFFHESLERAAVVVHGRHSHEGGSRANGRYRLVATRQISALQAHPTLPKALLWNPQMVSLAAAWQQLEAPDGMLAVIGGPDINQMFLERGYDAFHLSRVPGIRLPGGRPAFSGMSQNDSPETLLRRHGLTPGAARMLDTAAGVTLVTWQRRDGRHAGGTGPAGHEPRLI